MRWPREEKAAFFMTTKTKGLSDRVASQVEEVSAFLEQQCVLYVECYCRYESCAVREVHIHLKDFDRTLVEALRVHGFCCPVCGRGMVLHWVRDPDTHMRECELEARWSVNQQMYVRDYCRDGLAVIDGSVMGDDRLPPTPDGWFSDSLRPVPRRRFV